MTTDPKSNSQEICPKCGSPLAEITTTKTGKKLQRCSTGSWDAEARENVGCDYVKWLEVEPQTLDEKCPKCGSNLILAVTRFGKKMKKCSKGGWNKETREATGCDYIEWINGTTEPLDEDCPQCGSSRRASQRSHIYGQNRLSQTYQGRCQGDGPGLRMRHRYFGLYGRAGWRRIGSVLDEAN